MTSSKSRNNLLPRPKISGFSAPSSATFLVVRHGIFCLGCCWALMLVGFAAGVANLWWMAALTAVMVIEKTARWGHRLVAPVGVVLMVIGVGVVAIQAFSFTLF